MLLYTSNAPHMCLEGTPATNPNPLSRQHFLIMINALVAGTAPVLSPARFRAHYDCLRPSLDCNTRMHECPCLSRHVVLLNETKHSIIACGTEAHPTTGTLSLPSDPSQAL
jgi:hypothetical protein